MLVCNLYLILLLFVLLGRWPNDQFLCISKHQHQRSFVCRLVAKLEEKAPDQIETFKTNMNKVMKELLGRFKDLQFFTGKFTRLLSFKSTWALVPFTVNFKEYQAEHMVDLLIHSSVRRHSVIPMNGNLPIYCRCCSGYECVGSILGISTILKIIIYWTRLVVTLHLKV